jgi:hypothetical protein
VAVTAGCMGEAVAQRKRKHDVTKFERPVQKREKQNWRLSDEYRRVVPHQPCHTSSMNISHIYSLMMWPHQ